jgi:hypothetical protein
VNAIEHRPAAVIRTGGTQLITLESDADVIEILGERCRLAYFDGVAAGAVADHRDRRVCDIGFDGAQAAAVDRFTRDVRVAIVPAEVARRAVVAINFEVFVSRCPGGGDDQCKSECEASHNRCPLSFAVIDGTPPRKLDAVQ